MLSGLASLSSLFCMGMIAFIPNLVYVPWPRPYSDLTWWQFALLRLPFVSLVLAIVIVLLAGLGMRGYTGGRPMRLYYCFVALALLALNLAIIL